jgi:AraC-like DNA-binding protein
MNQNIIETDIEKVKSWPGACNLDSDFIIVDQLANAPFPTTARRMNFILMGLCTKGEVTYTMDTREYTLRPGNVILVSERHVVDGYNASPDFEGLCMMISMPFYSEIMRNVSDVSAMFLFAHNNPLYELTERDQKVFGYYYNVIKNRLADTDNVFRRDLVRTLILAMFYDLGNVIYRFQQVKAQRQTRADIIFTQFIRLVEQHCHTERRVSWYAKQLDITPKYLSEMVKNVSKRTPNEWIDNYVVLEIRVTLKNSSKSIKTIAEEMNFANQSFLGKYFKEHVGMSPSEYRKS